MVPGGRLKNGLQGFWPLTEGGGQRVYDRSGRGNHGTLTNWATFPGAWVNRNGNNVVYYNEGTGVGADTYITVGSAPPLDDQNIRFTWACRVYLISLGRSSQSRFMSKSSVKNWLVQNGPNNFNATITRATTNASFTSNNNEVTLGAWMTLFMTWDESDGIRMYKMLDGQRLKAVSIAARATGAGAFTTDAADPLILGNRIGGGTYDRPIDGYAEWFATWDRNLSFAEMQQFADDPYGLLSIKSAKGKAPAGGGPPATISTRMTLMGVGR